jgi:hypothetical protein
LAEQQWSHSQAIALVAAPNVPWSFAAQEQQLRDHALVAVSEFSSR